MSDDWSLKTDAKKIKLSVIKLLDCINLVDMDKEVYATGDIEILKQKLIEDLCPELSKGTAGDYIPQETIFKCINKRFGEDVN